MKNDKGAPISTERIAAATTQELDEKFRAWMNEWRHKIDMLDQRWDDGDGGPLWVEIVYYVLQPSRVRVLPFKTVQTVLGDKMEGKVALWQSGKNVCEYAGDASGGVCDTSGFYYGTPAEDEPKYCARHFYRNAVFGVDKQDRLIVG